MKPTRIFIAALLLIALGACNEHHETVTGAYGNAMVAGQVVMSGSGSAAGVRVSVRGTGMSATLAGDGQFAFANVPENVVLDFTRAADDIEASMDVEANSGFLVVELAQSSAHRSSRRRSTGPTRDKVYELEGVIRSVAADSIVVFTSHKEEVTVTIASDTIIRQGHDMLAAADLVAGARVHVKTKKVDDVYTAIQIILQNGGGDDGGENDPPAVREYEGTVQSASDAQLVVFTSHRETVTFVLTAETDIRKGNTPVAPASILIGTRVHVKAAQGTDGSNTATQVIVQNTRVEAHIEGTVASVAASSLVVTTAAGDVTVTIVNATQIRKHGGRISSSDIHVGDAVEVEGTQTGAATIEANKITVEDD